MILHTIVIEVTEEWLKNKASEWGRKTGIYLSPQQMLEFYKLDGPFLTRCLQDDLDDDIEEAHFSDIFSQKLLGIRWPGSWAIDGEFHTKIKEAAKKAGIKIYEDDPRIPDIEEYDDDFFDDEFEDD